MNDEQTTILNTMQAAIFLPDAEGGYKRNGAYIVLRKGVSAAGLLDALAGAFVVTDDGKVCEGSPHVTYLRPDGNIAKALDKHFAPKVKPVTDDIKADTDGMF